MNNRSIELEATLRLALEFVEANHSGGSDAFELITAIKEALMSFQDGVQPEQPKVRTGACLLTGVCASEGHKIQKAQPEPEPVAWTDKADEWSDEIALHHPFKTKAYKQWDTAMAMVGARHSKGALVELVCWLLQKSAPPQRTAAEGEDTRRAWVGLTPQERDEINEQVYGAVPHHVAFHHAIEAKLKEKNNGT